MNIIIVSPSLDSAKNVSGISSVTQFIIENNPEHHYIHFELGRKNGTRGGLFRIGAILHAYKEWKKLLIRHSDALIHYNFPLEKPSILRDPLFMRAGLKNGNRMVVHIHGGIFLTTSTIPFPFNKILQSVFKWNVPFIALSDKETDILKRRFNVKYTISLPNCIDLQDASTFQKKEKTEEETLVLGYLGRIAKTKGLDYLLSACKMLKEQGVPFKLRVAGAEEVSGKLLPQFYSLGESFEYCGLVSGERKCQFLRSLDVFVLPSYFEGLPMSLLECMSYGAVPVITPVGSIVSVVEDNKNGLFIRVKDIGSIVTSISWLNNNRQVLCQMSKDARNTIFENFSPDNYVGRLNQIYKYAFCIE